MRSAIARSVSWHAIVIRWVILGAGAMLMIHLLCAGLLAGGGFFRNGAVGGVSIDAQGVLRQAPMEARQKLREAIEAELQAVPPQMDGALALRRVSLRRLEAALREADRDLKQLPEELRYLAGLQRIQFVLVYPEQQDVVLVGPAEGWRVNDQGVIVGKSTGQPVIQIDDLLIALHTTWQAEEGISCSIDPTPEGIQAMRQFVRRQKRFSPDAVDEIARQMGPQQITISGVPETSHFARVLVAADYRMKRIAMRLEPSPLAELPSFMDMLAESRSPLTNMMPRWWLACDYEPLARSDDGLAWELRGRGVRVMTEDDHVANDGTVTVTGEQNPIAARWADQMTRQYTELSREQAIFGQLRNLMDMSVIAALMRKEQLLERAGCELPILIGENHDLQLPSWNPPKSVATECSVTKRGRDYLITASGGVQIDALRYASQSQVAPQISQVHTDSRSTVDRWWW